MRVCKYCNDSVTPLATIIEAFQLPANFYYCVENALVGNFKQDITLTVPENCVHYNWESEFVFICLRCRNGFFLENNSCVETCTDPINFKQVLL